jgi:Cellulose biosynthesis protein BcsN
VSGGRLGRGTAAAGVALLMAIVDGCAAPRTIVANESERQVSVDQAFVSLGPSAPPVLSIVEHPYENATRQTLRLATRGSTPGENTLRVDVIGIKNPGISPDATLSDAPLEAAQLSSEAEDALPGVPLRTSLTYLQNRSGPFGYAVGKSAQGDECIYAWQRVATPDRDLSVVNSRNTLSLRLRLCEPNTSEAALLASMMGLNVNVGLSGGLWTPEPKQFASEIGSPGTAIGPPGVLAAVSPDAERAARPPRRRSVKPGRGEIVEAPIAAPTQNPLTSDAVLVPPPLAGPASPAAQGPVVPIPEGAKTPGAKP